MTDECSLPNPFPATAQKLTAVAIPQAFVTQGHYTKDQLRVKHQYTTTIKQYSIKTH